MNENRPPIWESSEGVRYPSGLFTEWPWTVLFVRDQNLIDRVETQLDSLRAKYLLKHLSNSSVRAKAKGIQEPLEYAEPIGGWRTGDRKFLKRVVKALSESITDVIRSESPLVIEPGKSDLLYVYSWECGFLTDDNRSCWAKMVLLLRAIRSLRPWRENWKFNCKDFWPCQVPSHKKWRLVGIHIPTSKGGATRDASRTLQIWTAVELKDAIREMYGRHASDVASYWTYTSQPDPFYRMLTIPSEENLNEALIFAEQVAVLNAKPPARRPGRKKPSHKQLAKRKLVSNRWDEFRELYAKDEVPSPEDLGTPKLRRGSFEHFSVWAGKTFTDMPSNDVDELRRLKDSHRKTPEE